MGTPKFVKRLNALVAEMLELGWDATRFDMAPDVARALSELLDAGAAWERMHEALPRRRPS